MMTDKKLEQLEARLFQAEARLAIMDLEAEYARSWDAGDGEAWAKLFTDDGIFDMAEVGLQARKVYEGSAELTRFCMETDAFYKGLHFMHLPRLRIEDEKAFGRLHFQWIGLFSPNDRHHGRREAAGYYDVTYHYIDGNWKILHRLEKAISGQIIDNFDVYMSPEF